MTSMLFSASMTISRLLLRRGLFDVLADDVLVRGEPVGHLLELSALHLPDLDEPAALVLGGRHLQRRHEAAQREAADLLEPLLGVLAADPAVAPRLHRTAER